MDFMPISSKNNERVKQICALMRSSSERKEKGLFVLEGLRLCRDAAYNGVNAEELYFTQRALDKYPQDIVLIAEHSARSYLVSEDVFAKMSQTDSAQGVMTILQNRDPLSIADLDKRGRYVACAEVADPGNLGAIARTAEALGVDGMLLLGSCCDLYNPKALRASMGALLRLPTVSVGDTAEGVERLRVSGFEVFASVVDADAESVLEVDFSEGSVVIIGNEANGISESVVELCDRRVTIPIKGRAESFNAAAAAAILLWELMKL